MTNNDHGSFGDTGEVVFVRTLPGPIERVWEYLTDPAKRALWLAGGSIDLRVGGQVHLEFHHDSLTPHEESVPEKYRELVREGCGFTAVIIRCEPPRLLSHTWGEADGSESEVTFELTPLGDQVRLVLMHRKLPEDRDNRISVSAGWHIHVAILIAKLEDFVPPPFWETHTRLEDEYDCLIG
ncbi:SRPBCC family protein [Phragmitibacter flavus]|uniref:SRPBCC family protein n=1 Tax=Phragmitibacter flavus TaxID=2576071 RepID=A0A5R8KGI4_9BACT|nr:SRPBCC family protein [Phragmitibacter flavus]TLD71341.1 SRPBCC family protein [Phragmitibacter flavus]